MTRYEEQPSIVNSGSQLGPGTGAIIAELQDLEPGLYKVRVVAQVSAGDSLDDSNLRLIQHDVPVCLIPFSGADPGRFELELKLELSETQSQIYVEVPNDRSEMSCLYNVVLIAERVR